MGTEVEGMEVGCVGAAGTVGLEAGEAVADVWGLLRRASWYWFRLWILSVLILWGYRTMGCLIIIRLVPLITHRCNLHQWFTLSEATIHK